MNAIRLNKRNTKTKLVHTSLIMLMLLFASCEMKKEINMDIYYPSDKLVIHGYISEKEGAVAVVKKTVPQLAPDQNDTIFDAVVELYEDGKKLCMLETIDHFHYTTPGTVSISKTSGYHIRVSSKSLGEAISSAQYFPRKVELLHIEADNNNDAKVLFRTHPSHMCFLAKSKCIDSCSSEHYHNIPFFNSFGLIENNNDTLFYQIPFNYRNDNVISAIYSIYSFSPDLELFLISDRDYEYASTDAINEYTVEVHSNIDGGIGVFGAVSVCDTIINKP